MSEAQKININRPELASPYRSPPKMRPEKQFTFVPKSPEDDIKSSPRLRLLNEDIPSAEKSQNQRSSPSNFPS